mmetsp:Transcript_90090/g.270757  ORF Transcript_90090/g.270757 Transcript_90090/m.270757 type:complete len:221 (-) Transcript_90090:119-781(-)
MAFLPISMRSSSAGGVVGPGMMSGSITGKSDLLTTGKITLLGPTTTLFVAVMFFPLYNSPPCGQIPSASRGRPVFGLGRYMKLLELVMSTPTLWPAAKIQHALHMSMLTSYTLPGSIGTGVRPCSRQRIRMTPSATRKRSPVGYWSTRRTIKSVSFAVLPTVSFASSAPQTGRSAASGAPSKCSTSFRVISGDWSTDPESFGLVSWKIQPPNVGAGSAGS